MPKVTMIGAGSAVFARTVITDTLAIDGLTGVCALVEASTDRREVLQDTDYVVNSIEVAGQQNVRADYDIPLRYGVDFRDRVAV